MTRKIKAARGGRLLSFEQDGDFFFRLGMAKMDKNDLLGAMANCRLALDKDPENPDIILSVAEILTAMERYDESNRLLMVRFHDESHRPARAYFSLGCNFMAQREYGQARMSFDKYLEMEPDGEYAYPAYDMAEAIDGGEAPGQDERNGEHLQAASTARRMMEQEDFKRAAEELEKIAAQAPELTGVRNSLAMAYYCMRQYDKATEQVGMVLREDPGNIQAHCNLAIFMRGARDDVGLKREVEYLKSAAPESLDDLNGVGVTLMEVREFKAAMPAIRKLAAKRPYDSDAVHHLGLCAYYTGEYEFAARCYDKLLSIDRHDSVARYYRRVCRAAKNGSARHMGLTLGYQVPADEVILRIRRMNEYIKLPREELKKQWYPGSDIETLTRWGLTLPDASIKRAMLSFSASFRDKTSENILRDFALRRENGVEIKRDAFGLLKSIGAEEPYLSYINGELMESRVSMVSSLPDGVPENYGRIIERCVRLMQGIRSSECIDRAIGIWSGYVERLNGYPPISRGQVLALASAIEYQACRDCKQEVTKWELCSKYGISISRFNNAMAKLNKTCGPAKPEGGEGE